MRWGLPMAKDRSIRARGLRPEGPPPVRILKPLQPFQQPQAAVKDILAAAGLARRPGAVAVHSGLAHRSANSVVVHPGMAHRGAGAVVVHSAPDRRSGRLHSHLNAEPVLPGWGWWRWDIPAPPPGELLWCTLEFASQWWKWSSFLTATNDSGYAQHIDFGVTWRWMLLPNAYEVPGAPASMQDGARYEFYASKPVGSRYWTAWWVHPARSVTLTPYGKESDPNALALLLSTERSGELQLMFAYQFPWSEVTINGQEAHGYTIDGGPDTLFYSYGVAVPRSAEVEPIVTVEALQTSSHESAGRPKSRRRVQRKAR